ncbi:hypothetical protein [Myxococcus sp. SDU36]|uniref:hypothetical protein n=1 Tax=Myxococcus sp. SDU36 TaxID=2831967 RepID=UPI002542EAA8|nr:hypothetical protein [Myxococcus sp. SDU36]WIG97433.1 hypothetical protein KGD87_08645 [Myxococcus sp. SDU36]
MAGDIPLERLMAEAEAWPLLSRHGFSSALVTLRHQAPSVLSPETEAMARELEDYLRLRARGLSLEVLQGVREHAWFSVEDGGKLALDIALDAYLHRLATRHLEATGGTVRLRETPEASHRDTLDHVSHWRWLSLRLPPDLLIAALYSRGPSNPTTDRVGLVSPQLAHVLTHPVAETHLHEKAAFSFSQLWSSWMGGFLREVPCHDGNAHQGHDWPFGSQSAFTSMLLATAIVRALMAGYLLRVNAGRKTSFSEFCRHSVGRTAEAQHVRRALHDHWYWCAGAMRMMLRGPGPLDTASLCHSYRRLAARQGASRRPRNLEELHAADPMAVWMPGTSGRVFPETIFTTNALRAIHSGSADADFTRFFWQYQRIRCRAYDYLVLEPGTAGLDWFQRYFSRLKALRGDLDLTLFEAALEHESADLQLGALELRRTPPESWAHVCRDVQKLANGSLRFHAPPSTDLTRAPTEVGIVFHFIKERTNVRHPERRLHADPEGNGTGVRFGDWVSEQRRRALAVAGALERFPSMLLLIRGLDVASSELAAPTWATLSFLEEARRASIHASQVLASRGPGQALPKLGITYHVGEDFRRLVEGLRRIHEVVEFGAIQQGDRIGHGVALGVDPRQWAHSARMIPQPAEERINDLLWELDRYQRGDFTSSGERRERVRAELRRLLIEVQRDPSPDLDMYLEARRLLHCPRALAQMGYPRRVATGSNSAHPEHASEVVRRHLTSSAWFQRGQRHVTVSVDAGEIAMLEEAQRWLRWLLGRREVTIESNPSSNLLTSGLAAHESPPVVRLTLGPNFSRAKKRHRPTVVSKTPLLVSINTDDPITFSTRLADEYAYFYAGLMRIGMTVQEALAWVERARLAGWHSRFTLSRSADSGHLRELTRTWSAVLKPWSMRLRSSSPSVPLEEEVNSPSTPLARPESSPVQWPFGTAYPSAYGGQQGLWGGHLLGHLW